MQTCCESLICVRSCHAWAAQCAIRFFRSDPPTRASIPRRRWWRIAFENNPGCVFFWACFQALEAVNTRLREIYPESEELFDVVLVTNNHAYVGLRLINTINHHRELLTHTHSKCRHWSYWFFFCFFRKIIIFFFRCLMVFDSFFLKQYSLSSTWHVFFFWLNFSLDHWAMQSLTFCLQCAHDKIII